MKEIQSKHKHIKNPGGAIMKKIAIIRCLDVSMRCAGASCMKSFNNHTVKFERYGDEELELFSMMT